MKYNEININTIISASDAESIYESRKLLIRQIQGQIAKQVHEERDSVSEYDSWSDLEDNFALAYEPIPLSIKLDTWRKMSKKEILRKVNSKKVRKDFEYLTHGEIIAQIEKMQLNARYLSSKFGINHLMTHLDTEDNFPDSLDNIIDNDITETETEQSEDNLSVASFVSGKEIYLSRAEILNKLHHHKAGPDKQPGVTRVNKSPITSEPAPAPSDHKVRSSRDHVNNGKLSPARKLHNHDSWSSRASSILKDPEAIYVSRVELLQKINVIEPSPRKGKSERKSPGAGPVEKRERRPRQHDSWSSRASSILAAMDAEHQVCKVVGL